MNGWRLDHTYGELPALFHAQVASSPVREPRMVLFNTRLARRLGLDADALNTPHGAAVLAGNALPDGARPLAQAYAGHQFGHFTALGDGRAILLGEQIAPDGQRFDVQLKGPGPTPYSRRGDGRAALGPMLREYIISEGMHALGIPTTRSLAVVATGEPVYRERVLPGAVLTRVAASHLRVGTFQWAAAHRDESALRALADYTIRRHYPDVSTGPHPYVAMLDAIVERQARLIAAWQLVGFVHGVMNTDNMSIAGETIDYGPCAFMDAYDPETVFSSIDAQGRYAYGNQPAIAEWNLVRLGEALLPLFDRDEARAIEMAQAALERFSVRYEHHWLAGMRAKLGLFTEEAGDAALVNSLLTWMHDAGRDFTNSFRALSLPGATENVVGAPVAWHQQWQARLARQPQPVSEVATSMQRHNPAVIPRNHKVEEALDAAGEGELGVVHRLLDMLATPFDHHRELGEYANPPASSGRPYRTFCGT